MMRPIHRRHARPAFTMIEIIVAISIIVLLLGISVVALKNVGASGQASQTRALLERLKNVVGEATLNKAGAVQLYEVQIPKIYGNPFNATTPGDAWDAVPASSAASLDCTKRMLALLQSTPNAKKLFDELPTERKRVEQILVQPNDTVPRSVIVPLDAWGNPILFVFDNWQDQLGAGRSRPHRSATNIDNTVTPSVGIEVGGLTDLYTEAGTGYWELGTRPRVSESGTDYRYNKEFVAATPPRKGYTNVLDGGTKRSPDHRPFWVSGGPDGKLETNDDNVYSFEN